MKKKGFTLVELLAVIIILGVLLSISAVAVGKIRKNQEAENKKNIIRSILTGARRYATENGFGALNGLSVQELVDAGDYVDFDTEKYYDDLVKDQKVWYYSCGDRRAICVGKNSDCKKNSYNDCGCEPQQKSGTGTLCKGKKLP